MKKPDWAIWEGGLVRIRKIGGAGGTYVDHFHFVGVAVGVDACFAVTGRLLASKPPQNREEKKPTPYPKAPSPEVLS